MPDLGGINPQHAVAGFGGGLAYLPFMEKAGRWTVLGAVTAGVVTAVFLTPLVSEILSHQRLFGAALSHKAELGLAFILGLTSMILLPAIINAATWVKDNVASLMLKVTGTQPKSEDKPNDLP